MTRTALNPQGLTKAPRSVSAIMAQVMLALLPGTVIYAWMIDVRVVSAIAIACVAALCFEGLLLSLRKRPLQVALSDGSIIVAAWLLALCVPPSLPVWQLLIGVFVMTSIGKHLFGGLGHNPFNPAMVAYAVLLVSFPVTMTDWSQASTDPSGTTHVESNLARNPDQAASGLSDWDGLTGATALDRLRSLKNVSDQRDDLSTLSPAAKQETRLTNQQAGALIMQTPWIWVSIAWLAGGLFLLYTRIISWHIPSAVIGTLSMLYLASGLLGSGLILPLIPALLSGAILLGAFFIATDPVSAAASKTGKLIYGAGIGVLTFIIREYSVYPEGFAFAVLLMNICVPLIDHLCARGIGKPDVVNKRS